MDSNTDVESELYDSDGEFLDRQNDRQGSDDKSAIIESSDEENIDRSSDSDCEKIPNKRMRRCVRFPSSSEDEGGSNVPNHETESGFAGRLPVHSAFKDVHGPTAKCIVNIKESLEELESCSIKLWPALTAENDEESVQVQTLTATIAQIANGIGRDGSEQIGSSDIQELLELQDEDLTETDLEKMLNSQPIEEEASTSTANMTFNLESLSEGLRIANEASRFLYEH
uniref:Uncharacterized protein n=1 Tax=Glossina morsitans morsitans TaxID=37546 RepID=A0A1B0GCS1_GLOMM